MASPPQSGDWLGKAEHMRVGALLRSLMLVMVMVLFVAACSSDEPASGPITIEAKLDVSVQPIVGTFEVTEGADTLGCSAGTFVDDPGGDELKRVMTCSGPNTGTFTHSFDPLGYDTGPGEQNGPWRMVDATADFTGLQGGGDWWGIGTTETITGDIEYTS